MKDDKKVLYIDVTRLYLFWRKLGFSKKTSREYASAQADEAVNFKEEVHCVTH